MLKGLSVIFAALSGMCFVGGMYGTNRRKYQHYNTYPENK